MCVFVCLCSVGVDCDEQCLYRNGVWSCVCVCAVYHPHVAQENSVIHRVSGSKWYCICLQNTVCLLICSLPCDENSLKLKPLCQCTLHLYTVHCQALDHAVGEVTCEFPLVSGHANIGVTHQSTNPLTYSKDSYIDGTGVFRLKSSRRFPIFPLYCTAQSYCMSLFSGLPVWLTDCHSDRAAEYRLRLGNVTF